MVDDDTPTITLTIMVGSGGGFVVYDVSNSVSKLAFGGNLDETTAYLNSIMGSMAAHPGDTTMPVQQVTKLPATFRKVGQSYPARLADALNDKDI